MKIIDISEHQGIIEWEKVKPNIDGVIVRAGYGSKGTPDKRFTYNVSECNRLGIPCGAYWFSYATTPAEAEAEARALLKAVKPYRIELPLAFDFEYDSVKNAKNRGVNVTKELGTSLVYAFCETIEAGGYWCINYANPDFLSHYYAPEVPQRFGLWLAKWPGGSPDVTKKPRPDVQMWQWGGSPIPGITPGKDVDTNESYIDFAKLIRESKLNHLDNHPSNSAAPLDSLEWCKANGIAPNNVTASTPVTWGDLANVLHKPD